MNHHPAAIIGAVVFIFAAAGVIAVSAVRAQTFRSPTAPPPGGNIPVTIWNRVSSGARQTNAAIDIDGNALIGGNVGIGTVAPAAKLDVAGNTRVFLPGNVTTHFIAANGVTTHYLFNYIEGSLYLGAGRDIADNSRNNITLYNYSCSPNTPGGVDYNCNVPQISLYADKTFINGDLTVSGRTEMTGFRLFAPGAGAGRILTSDADGVGSWQALPPAALSGSGAANYVAKFSAAAALGTSQLFDDGARVGIGTAAPAAKLDVAGTIRVTDTQNKSWTNEEIYGAYEFYSQDGSVPGARTTASMKVVQDVAGTPVSPGGGLAFYTASNGAFETEKLRISSSGNVGIGTTGPSLGKLEVAQTSGSNAIGITAGSAINFGNDVYMRSVSWGDGLDVSNWNWGGPNRPHIIAGAFRGTGTMASYFTGNVGIGTAAPDVKLSVNGAARISGANRLFFGDAGSGEFIYSERSGAFPLVLAAGGIGRMWVLNGGSVGIGTEGPDQLLTVNGGASKPGGGSWSTFSDRRLKEDIASFDDGLEVIRRINPVSFAYNGLAGTPKGLRSIGVVAQDVKGAAPYTVDTYMKKLRPDDSAETELYRFDPSALTFVAINAVKELDAAAVKIDSVGAVRIGGDLSAERNVWGSGSGWRVCPAAGECACPDGSYVTRIKNNGAQIYCNKL